MCDRDDEEAEGDDRPYCILHQTRSHNTKDCRDLELFHNTRN